MSPGAGLGALEEKCFVPAKNRTKFPQLSNPHPSHYTDCAIQAPHVLRYSTLTLKPSISTLSPPAPKFSRRSFSRFSHNNLGRSSFLMTFRCHPSCFV